MLVVLLGYWWVVTCVAVLVKQIMAEVIKVTVADVQVRVSVTCATGMVSLY